MVNSPLVFYLNTQNKPKMTVPEIATSFLEDQFEELSKLKAGIQNYFQLADAIELGLGVKN